MSVSPQINIKTKTQSPAQTQSPARTQSQAQTQIKTETEAHAQAVAADGSRSSARASSFEVYPKLIRNIWAVGRNYALHAKELGNPTPAIDDEPIIFLKAGSSAVPSTELGGTGFSLPGFTDDIHHEAEIALEFGQGLNFCAIGLALDLTARMVQSLLKEKQLPWTLAKSFAAACPLSELLPIPRDFELDDVRFEFQVNGEIRQKGHTRDMIFSAERLRQYLIARYPIVPGDLLLTGTPSGVGPIRKGDCLTGQILTSRGETFLKTAWQVLP